MKEGTNGLTAAVFHLMIPLRATHAKESHSVETIFQSVHPIANEEDCCESVNIGTLEMMEYERASGHGAREVIKYKYFRIGWGTRQ